MKRCIGLLIFGLWLPGFAFAWQTLSPTLLETEQTTVLARVELAGPAESFPLPVHAFLQDRSRKDYLLAISTEAQLHQAGWPWCEIDKNAVAEEIVIATELRPGARATAAGRFLPLLDDGRHWILRATSEDAEELAELGFALHRLSPEPIVWSRPSRPIVKDQGLLLQGPPIMPDPFVSAMVLSVQTTNLYWLVRRLSGEEPIVAGGEPRVITTRHTPSGLPLRKAVELVSERLRALNLDVQYHPWSASGRAGTNVVATLVGGAQSNELVLVTAHLDNMPSGALAPGADDNASGCAAVLVAAGICSQYKFDRSIRFILFTGEEQGLLGSGKYAQDAYAAGDNIVAVLNLDMIAWNGSAPATFQLHTRTTSNPGYTNDLAIASVFTNAVTAYGLTNHLVPVIKPDAISASDHQRFWDKGYAAILGIEDYGGDFNPYYHTVNDTLSRFNLPYFTASVQATVATVAHLAGTVSRVPADVVEVVSSDWTPGSGIGAVLLLVRHLPDATETGFDLYDLAALNAPANPNPSWLELTSEPYVVPLVTDSRPTNSATIFAVDMKAAALAGTDVSCSNRLRFDFVTPPAPERIYTARIQIDGQFAPPPEGFLCVTNLREVVTQGGFVQLPNLSNAPAGTVYGTCELAMRFLDKSSANCHLRLLPIVEPTLTLATDAQIGVRIIDDLEVSTNLVGNNWVRLTSFTNDVIPDLDSFETGWKQITRTVDSSSLPQAPQHYFRLKRSWLTP